MNMMQDFDDSKMYESIFGQDEPWNQSTAPGRLDERGWEHYAMAYKIAADRLVNSLQIGPISEHYQVFPITFLYRHYLELKIKEILLTLRGWEDRESAASQTLDGISKQPLNRHTLTPFWTETRQLLDKFDHWVTGGCANARFEEGAAICNAIEQRLKEFDEIDAKAENFRYPVNNKLEPNPTKLLERHEIVHMKKVVNALHMYLDGIGVGLDDILDRRNERLF